MSGREFPDINLLQGALANFVTTHLDDSTVLVQVEAGRPAQVPRQILIYYLGAMPERKRHTLGFIILGLVMVPNEGQTRPAGEAPVLTRQGARMLLNDWETKLTRAFLTEQNLPHWLHAGFLDWSTRPSPMHKLPDGQLMEMYIELGV